MKLNAEVTTTNVTQTANPILGTEEKTLYYLIIKNLKGEQLVINVGKKTHDTVLELTKEPVTNIQIDKPKQGGNK